MTPEARFTTVASSHPRCFWLDGGGARPWSGRRSLLGWLTEDDVSLTYDAARREVLRHRGGTSELVGNDIFTALERELPATAADEHWVGYLGYACRSDLPSRIEGTSVPRMPDAIWMRTRTVLITEQPAVRETGSPAHPPEGIDSAVARPGPPGGSSRDVPGSYRRAFDEVQEQLRAGNSYEVNLTHRIRVRDDIEPVTAYLRLRQVNPAPYAGFLQHHGLRLLSSSPERYATIARNRTIETRPIKGTTPRGTTTAADDDLRRELASSSRFRAENLMIVDLLRNDLALVCKPGSVTVPSLMEVESYPSVHQLVSTVRGRLRDGVSTVAALRALFPAGSMTGAPKLRTMEIIRNVESTPRGAYAGAFGWISPDGRADLGVVIRSLTTVGDGTWELGTGGGITVYSTPEDEYAETCWKAERLLRVFQEGRVDEQEV
jgi:para-aminobenzoate synthetase